MAPMMRRSGDRTPAKTLRSDSVSVRSDLQAIRAGSHNLRIGANPSVAREAARDAMASTGLSQKSMALTAGVSESVLSDALNGRGRNLETDWLLAQESAFVTAFLESVNRRLGLTAETRRSEKAARIAELVRLIVEVA